MASAKLTVTANNHGPFVRGGLWITISLITIANKPFMKCPNSGSGLDRNDLLSN